MHGTKRIEKPVMPAPAASLILVRPGVSRPEFLLLRRHAGARFMPGAYVFPGGAVDTADASEAAFELCRNLDDTAASHALSLPAKGLSYFIAAIRECFEECGILLAIDAGRRTIDLGTWSEAALLELRTQVVDPRIGIIGICNRYGWGLPTDLLSYYSHWITPAGLPLRFDARFFIARAPEGQRPFLVGEEMSRLVWCAGEEALARSASGELQILEPTSVMLRELTQFKHIDALMGAVRAPRAIAPR